MLAATRKAFTTIPNVASKATYATASQAVQISTAQNGIKVAAIEDAGETAGLSIVVNGGARLENGSNAGAAHFLKNYGFKNNANRTAFRVAREAELSGAVLSSNLTHESIVYSAEFLTGDAEHCAELLGDVVSNQKFQDHEFIDVAKQTAADSTNAWATPEIVAIEAAHQVAFRSGLGNSIFARPSSKVNNAAVKSFAAESFTSGNIALVGSGLDLATVERLASYIQVPTGQAPSTASKYFGGESRLDQGTGAGHYVLAFEGAAATSAEFAATQVLQYALGGAQQVKFAPASGLLGQTAAKLAEGTEIKAFNFGYSDAGLFGVYISGASTESTSSAVAATAEQLKAVANGLTAEDFQRAVAQAKFAAATSFATRLDRLETIGAQTLHSGKYTSASDFAASLDNLSVADVAKVAQQVLKSKATAVAVGDVYNLPFADSISL
ncbi:Metalloenzyme, LuxS/M16 peptidase-like protein [Absidia repens]|uniref:Cytochrome b-c1 complex subunit 2, mitochondrial n=1 Tax=Absidia repens TaxID=90262 RepID=A0A1X2ICY0_9FUNG|nr:Metalloenzyme, LuxS/M16 peptidase-like protein [Absidia repens]